MKQKLCRAIVTFFIVMLCCTFTARGAASVTTAKVQTAKLKSGKLTRRFQGEGTIQSSGQSFVSLPEGQKVAEILAESGNDVAEGQNLVRLDLEYLEEQIRSQEREIQKLELTLQQQQLDGQTEERLPATAQAELTLKEAQEALAKARQDYDALQKETDSENAEALTVAKEQVNAAETALKQAEDAYALAQQEEENMQANEAARKKSSELAQQSTKLELEALREKLEKLYVLQNAEGILTAQTNGVLESVGAEIGSITTGTEQIVIQTGKPKVCGILPKEAVGIVKEGDEMQVTVQGDTSAITVKVETFGNDSEGNVVWYGMIEDGDYRSGTTLTYEYSRQSEKDYDAVIPLSALYESNGETYILTAEVRSGILGEQYTAVKTPVTVLEKDEEHAAVETTISKETLFITAANKYVEEGDRIRLSE